MHIFVLLFIFVFFLYNNILLRLVYYMVVIRSDIPVLVLFLHHHNNLGSSINLAVYLSCCLSLQLSLAKLANATTKSYHQPNLIIYLLSCRHS